MKKTGLIFLVIVFVSLGSSAIVHEVDADKDSAEINTTLELDADEPVNSWNVNYRLPENSRILKIEDSYGEIKAYTSENDRVDFSTNSGDRRTEEFVRINYVIDREPREFGEGLYSWEFSFAGYSGQETSGTIRTEDLISGRVGYGFDVSYNQSMKFRGEGPVRVTANFGEGEETDYYSFFGPDLENISTEDMDQAYEIALGTVKYQQRSKRFPVVVDSDYEGEEWSAGEYISGRIALRPRDDAMPVLVHETVHGLNDRLLAWDNTDSAWFDEGVAKHAENLARVKEDGRSRTSELFGEDVNYRDGGYLYTLSSRGDRDRLWEYYSSDEDYMKAWAPRKGNRNFGYAYSELIIKNHLAKNGSLTEIYDNVDPGRIESNEEKWEIYSEYLELRPCDFESRERFDQCLDKINSHEFEVLQAEPVESTGEVRVREVNIPERTPLERPVSTLTLQDVFTIFENFVDYLFETLGL